MKPVATLALSPATRPHCRHMRIRENPRSKPTPDVHYVIVESKRKVTRQSRVSVLTPPYRRTHDMDVRDCLVLLVYHRRPIDSPRIHHAPPSTRRLKATVVVRRKPFKVPLIILEGEIAHR